MRNRVKMNMAECLNSFFANMVQNLNIVWLQSSVSNTKYQKPPLLSSMLTINVIVMGRFYKMIDHQNYMPSVIYGKTID